MKTYQDFLKALATKESGGSYTIVNDYNYLGKYQMGELALIDAGYYNNDGTKTNDWKGTWTGKDGINSKEDFLKTPQAQENAISAYIDKQWSYIKNYGLDKYIGQTINGTLITKSGLIAGSHLVGVGGLKKYLESGGQNNVADANKTTISSYIRKFGGYDIDQNVTPSAPQALPGDEYIVKSGDTLSKIAKEHGLTIKQLLEGNPEIADPNLINIGQKIRIPLVNEGTRGLNFDPNINIPRQGSDPLARCRSIFNAGENAGLQSSPIILDLDKDGVETTSLTSGTYFDLDNNGFAEQTGWASSDDGLLAIDRNNDGQINNGSELFGDNTLLADGTKASNGFQALAELDSNIDGKIDANDSAYNQLHSFRLLFSV